MLEPMTQVHTMVDFRVALTRLHRACSDCRTPTHPGCGVGCYRIHHIKVSSRHPHRRSKRHLGLVYGSQLYSSHLLVERRQRHWQIGDHVYLMSSLREPVSPRCLILLLPRSGVTKQDRFCLHHARLSFELYISPAPQTHRRGVTGRDAPGQSLTPKAPSGTHTSPYMSRSQISDLSYRHHH